MPTNHAHRAKSIDHLNAVQAHADQLREEYAKDRPDRDAVTALNASIGRGIKLAEVHALIAIGDELAQLRASSSVAGAAFLGSSL